MATKKEQQWQAESDAQIMASYQEILGDKARMRRAVNVARKKAEDLTKRASALQSVASYAKGGRVSRRRK